MEIVTQAKNISEAIRNYGISPDQFVRIVYAESEAGIEEKPIPLPRISRDEQVRMLDLLSGAYDPGASEELVEIIGESRVNTEFPGL